MNNKQNGINIDDFLYSIDKMVGSKYILAEQRISDILRSIAESKQVYNLIAECMINFDFAVEWAEATKGSYLKLPLQEAKKISFIFCLLSNVDDKVIELTKILESYFSYDRNISAYELFCKQIIIEFRNLIAKQLGLYNAVSKTSNEPEIESSDEFSMLYDLVYNFNESIMRMKKLKHSFIERENLVAIISTFLQIIRNKQVEYFYSYKVTILSAIRKNRELLNDFRPIDKLIDEIIRG